MLPFHSFLQQHKVVVLTCVWMRERGSSAHGNRVSECSTLPPIEKRFMSPTVSAKTFKDVICLLFAFIVHGLLSFLPSLLSSFLLY